MKKLVATAVVAWGIVALVGAVGGAYSTTFPLTENPISEGGNWINGKAVGLDWANVRTTPGLAFGTQTGSAGYNDSIAILAGTWSSNQTATATVHTVNQQSGNTFEEVELLLRFSISAHSATGYEVLFACRPPGDGARYVQIVRWNGPLGDWTLLDARAGPGIVDADRIKATIVGDTITLYVNDVEIFHVHDSTYASGSPGMGYYLQGGTGALAGDYGLSSYTASGGLAPPRAPSNLRIVRQ
jgi:hypothetical protein